ncbi:MAG TPA: hypothetical protein VHZ32_00265 [Rhizomicrobium sp.]|jgi:hypothetical protein|nr:hypothetical protein [Rhizomicrobium sp.]
MANDFIPDDVRDFIVDHLGSVAQLEALLLLRRHGEESWTPATLAERLYVGEAVAAEVLTVLAAAKLCSKSGQVYRYTEGDAVRQDLMERLADCYAHYLIPVTNLIHGKPARIQKFADAFRFRKDN